MHDCENMVCGNGCNSVSVKFGFQSACCAALDLQRRAQPNWRCIRETVRPESTPGRPKRLGRKAQDTATLGGRSRPVSGTRPRLPHTEINKHERTLRWGWPPFSVGAGDAASSVLLRESQIVLLDINIGRTQCRCRCRCSRFSSPIRIHRPCQRTRSPPR